LLGNLVLGFVDFRSNPLLIFQNFMAQDVQIGDPVIKSL